MSEIESFCLFGVSKTTLDNILVEDADIKKTLENIADNEFLSVQWGIDQHPQDEYFIGIPPIQMNRNLSINHTARIVIELINSFLSEFYLPGKGLEVMDTEFYSDGGIVESNS